MSTSAATTEALIRKFVQLSNEHKLQETLSLATPTATWWNSGLKKQNPQSGHHTFEERIKDILGVTEVRDKITSEIVDIIVDAKGEKAVLEIIPSMKAEDGSYLYRNDMIFVFKVKDGKIKSIREYMDFYPVAKWYKEHGGEKAKAAA